MAVVTNGIQRVNLVGERTVFNYDDGGDSSLIDMIQTAGNLSLQEDPRWRREGAPSPERR